MKRLTHISLLAVLGLMLSAVPALAQSVATYSVVRTASITYNSIATTGNAVQAWRNNVSGNANYDDNRSYPVPIGFDFWYDGARYTQFSVSTNGFMDFSSQTWDGGPGTGGGQFNPFGPYSQDFVDPTRSAPSGGSGTTTAIAPFCYDLTTLGTSSPLGNSIKYLVTGAAPNRVLTVEWIKMGSWFDQTDTLNFQVKLYESSGVVELVYGAMVGAINTSFEGYAAGLNAPSISPNPPATAQLKALQNVAGTAADTVFNNGQQYMLGTNMPSNTRYHFTPRTPGNPSGLNFTSVTQTSMTLNWTTNANGNEVAYVIYQSTDGTNYNFITQLTAPATTYTASSLNAATTYYWRVYAVSEGALSSALQGSQSTAAAANDTTAQSGLWSSPTTWKSGIPGQGTNVYIADGHVVTLDVNSTVNSIQVGTGTSGTLKIGNTATPDTLTILANLTISNGGTITANTASASTGHLITISGNIQNNGTIDLAPTTTSRVDMQFTKSGTQTITGTGTLSRFNRMILNMGSSYNNILDVFPSNFTDTTKNFLVLNNGTFRFSTASADSIAPLSGNAQIPATAGLWVNSSSVAVTVMDSLTVAGLLRVSNGSLYVGTNIDNELISLGGTFVIEGGNTYVAGRFAPNDLFSITNFTITAGTFTTPTKGSTSNVLAPFTINVSGSVFNQTGGTIVIQKGGGTGRDSLGYLNVNTSSSTVLGGTLQIGNAATPVGDTVHIKTDIPLYNVTVQSANETARLDSSISVKGNVAINAGALTALANSIAIYGNWSDNGTFVPGTGTMNFSGSSAQSVSRTGGELFNNLIINNPGNTISLGSNVTVNGAFTLTAGTVGVGSNTLTLNSTVSGTGSLTSAVNGTVSYNQSSAGQAVLTANYGNLTFSNFAKTLPSSGTVAIAGVFTPGTGTGHTVTGSTVNFNGAGSQRIPGFTYNNLNINSPAADTVFGGNVTVQGALAIANGTTLNDNAATITVNGGLANSGTHTGSGVGAIVLTGGTSAHAITGGGSYRSITINDALGATMSGGMTINGTLTFQSASGGVLSSTSDTVFIAAGGSVVRSGVGHVNSALRLPIPNGNNSVIFPIGDATRFTPDTIRFYNASGSGFVTSSDSAGKHPQIYSASLLDPTNGVNRYWRLRNNGVTFDSAWVILAYADPSDLDQAGSELSLIPAEWNGTTWSYPILGTRYTGSVQAQTVTVLGDFALGAGVPSNAYRTKAGGNWNATTVWQYFNASTNSWRDTTAYPTNAQGTITIQSGHTITMNVNNLTIDQTFIDAGGTLVVTAGNTLRVNNGPSYDIIVNGTLKNSGTITLLAGPATVVVNAGGVYEHAQNGGTVVTATWDPASTCLISGATTTAPGGLTQTFGNFTWNNAGQTAALALAGNPTTVNGDFTVTTTNTGSLSLYANQTTTKNIFGNLVIQGGTTTIKTGTGGVIVNVRGAVNITGGSLIFTSSGQVTINDTSGFSMTAGTMTMTSGTSNSNGILNVRGDFSQTGGTITETSTGTGRGSIVFAKTGVQNYTGGGTQSQLINFTVNTGADLELGTGILAGGGTFTLSAGGTLGIGSTAGITTTGATGNVQVTGTRTYSTTANYIYNGSAAQVTGNGLAANINRLTINNASGVSLSGSTTLADSLKLLSGQFNVQTSTLTLNSVVYVTAGSLTSGSTGTVAYNQASSGQQVLAATYGNLTFSNFTKVLPSGTVSIAGTFTTGTAYGHTITGNTINFNGTGAQTVPMFLFNNLIVSGGNTKTLAASDTVLNALTIASGTTLADGGFTLTVNGNVTDSGVHTGTGLISLTGSTATRTLSGGGSFTNLTLNDAFGVSLSGNIAFNGMLTLTNGLITSATDTVIMNAGSAISRPVSGGYVNGKLRKNLAVLNPGTQTLTFEVGDAATYGPISTAFVNVSTTGWITGSTVGSAHPYLKNSGIDQTADVNRYWTLNNQGAVFASYNATFNFASSDVSPGTNPAAFFVKRYGPTSWHGVNTSSRTSTSTTASGLTGFGDFVSGQVLSYFAWTRGAGTYNWADADNWNQNSVPTGSNVVILSTPDTINVNVHAYAQRLTMANDTLSLTVLATDTLTLSDSLKLQKGTLTAQALFPSATAYAITGGTVNYNAASGTQNVVSATYNRLFLTGGGTKTAAGAVTVNDTLKIASGVTFGDGGSVITTKGAIANSGVHSGAGSILLTGGAGAHGVSGGGTFGSIQVNDALGVTLSGVKTTINGTLTLTAGNITLPNSTDTLAISSTGSVVRVAGYIIGTLQKYVPIGASNQVFDIGTSAKYDPVRLNFANVTAAGTITIVRRTGIHPNASNTSNQIDSTHQVNVWWRLLNNGVVLGGSYTATFAFTNPGELLGGVSPTAGDFSSEVWNGSAWSNLTVGQKSNDSTRADGLTVFGDFVLGKLNAALITSTGSGLFGNPAIWGGRVPGANDTIVVAASTTITLDANYTVAKLVVNASGTFKDSTFTLTVNGALVLNGSWSGSGKISLATAANDTIYGTGSATGTSTLEIAAFRVVHPTTSLTLKNISILAGDTVKNLGSMTVDSLVGTNATAVWWNALNSALTVNVSMMSTGALLATDAGNTVTYGGTGALTVLPTAYNNLTINNTGTKTISGSVTVNGVTTVNAASQMRISNTGQLHYHSDLLNDGIIVNGGLMDIN